MTPPDDKKLSFLLGEDEQLSLLPAVTQWKVKESEAVRVKIWGLLNDQSKVWQLGRYFCCPPRWSTPMLACVFFVYVCLCLSACHTVCLFLSSFISTCLPHLLLQYTVEDEDKHALQRVEDGEEVGHDHGALVDVHESKSPGQAQQT